MSGKIDLEKHNDAYEESKIVGDVNFNKQEAYLRDSFKKRDDRGIVLAAIIVSILLCITAVILFFHAFYYKDNNKSYVKNSESTVYDETEVNYESIKYEELTSEELEIKDTAVHFLDAVRKMDFDESYKYTEDNECSMDFISDEIKKEDTSIVQYNTFFKKMMDYDYTINKVVNNGDKATVKVVIKTYNFTTAVMDARLHISDAQIAYSFKNKNVSDRKKKEIAQEELEKILNGMDRKLKIPVEVELIKSKDGWKITSDSIDNKIKPAVMKNLYDSIDAYCEFYKALNNNQIKNGEISLDSFIKYLEGRGIHYDENSDKSPFK